VLINRSVTNGDDGIDTEGATFKWFKVDKCVVSQHPGLLNNLLLYVSLPYKVMCCCNGHTHTCTDYRQQYAIDQYYSLC